MMGIAGMLGRNALVVKEFKINEANPERVRIVARKAGLVAWLLSVLGIDSTTTLQIFSNRILFTEGSLSGQLKTCMPLSALSIATGGYFKPFGTLVTGVVLMVLSFYLMCQDVEGAVGYGIVVLIIAALFFLFYFLRKTLLLQVVSNSSWSASICFKRSVIEGVSVDYDRALKVIDIMNDLVMAQTSR